MNGNLKSPGWSTANDDSSSTIRVPCPGTAHRFGEECVICDEEQDGSISVVVTEIELGALSCAAQGQHVDGTLTPRLRRFGLLHDVAGYTVPTEEGFVLLRSLALRSN